MVFHNDPGFPKAVSRWNKGFQPASVWQYTATPVTTFVIVGRLDAEGGQRTERYYHYQDDAEQELIKDGWVKEA